MRRRLSTQGNSWRWIGTATCSSAGSDEQCYVARRARGSKHVAPSITQEIEANGCLSRYRLGRTPEPTSPTRPPGERSALPCQRATRTRIAPSLRGGNLTPSSLLPLVLRSFRACEESRVPDPDARASSCLGMTGKRVGNGNPHISRRAVVGRFRTKRGAPHHFVSRWCVNTTSPNRAKASQSNSTPAEIRSVNVYSPLTATNGGVTTSCSK